MVPPRITPAELASGKRNILGSVLRSLREERGLTQSSVVGRLQRSGWDVSRHVYGYIEDGSRALTDLELFSVLAGLGASPKDLEISFRGFLKKRRSSD